MYIIAQAPAAAGLTLSTGAATAAFSVIAGEPGAGTQVNLNAPGSNRLNGVPFIVRAGGNVVLAAGTYTSAATPFSVALYGSNTVSFAAAATNGLFTSTAIPIFTVSSAVPVAASWEIEGQFLGDNTFAKLMGRATAQSCTPAGAQTAVDAVAVTKVVPSTVNFAAEPPIQFTVGIVTAAANLLSAVSPAVANLTSFLIEA